MAACSLGGEQRRRSARRDSTAKLAFLNRILQRKRVDHAHGPVAHGPHHRVVQPAALDQFAR